MEAAEVEFAHGDFVIHEGLFAMVVDETSYRKVAGNFFHTEGWPVCIHREFEAEPRWVNGRELELTSIEEWEC